MKQLFKIDESEKRRILEMHENATKRNYLMEQGTSEPAASGTQSGLREPFTAPSGVKYKLPAITDNDKLSKFITINDGTLDKTFLAEIFGKNLNSLPNPGGAGARNITDGIFNLLRNYVDAAGQLVAKNSILCTGSNYAAALKTIAEKGIDDPNGLYKAVGSEEIFRKGVEKLLKIQINKLGGCQA